MTLPLAHSGHWYHTVLYILPVVLIALGLWWTGRGTGGDGAPGEPDPPQD